MNSPAVRGIYPPWDTMEAVCDVCGSDFGTGSVPVPCLRVRMDHCAAFYGCFCILCARAVHSALELYQEEAGDE